MVDIGVRAEEGIRDHAAGITHGAGPEERQHQVGAAVYAPITHGLAEVLIVALQAHVGSDVEEAEQAEAGVEDQAACVDAGIVELGLEQVVGQVAHVADIAEDIVDAVFEELRGHRLVALGDGLQRIGIEGIVEAEHGTVEALPGVILRSVHGDG
ncbi:hypothetical protein D3C85_1062890 [compost metagenome]